MSELKSSLAALASPSTLAGGKSSIQAALDAVKKSVDNVQSTVTSGDKPKLDALKSSISDLQKAIDNLNGLSGMSNVASAAASVAQAGQSALAALKAGCPSS